MHNTFLSIVTVVQNPSQFKWLPGFLENSFHLIQEAFSDFEFILINNTQNPDIEDPILKLHESIKKHIYLLNLSSSTNINHAFLAGLDRANGDYTILFELELHERPELIRQLYDKTQEHFDIVYLRTKERRIPLKFRPFYKLFYFILRHYSSIKVDENAFNTRIISRRALNSLLRLRENLKFMKPLYGLVGYQTSYIEIDGKSSDWMEHQSFRERFRTSLIAITSFTTFLRSLLLWIFIFSLIFLLGVVINALKVKFFGADLFGNPAEAVTGWTYLVVIISVFFAMTFLNLYIMSIYLSNIYTEIKQRPLYIIESVKRF